MTNIEHHVPLDQLLNLLEPDGLAALECACIDATGVDEQTDDQFLFLIQMATTVREYGRRRFGGLYDSCLEATADYLGMNI